MRCPRLMIAAQSSGTGKTTVTCGILQSLIDRGLKVSSFKCGPDYIDPMFHSKVIGARSKNLDVFFVDDDTLRYLFCEGSKGTDISIIEGAMGFYDGSELGSSRDSSCDVSMKISSPVVLIVDSSGASLSTVAVLKGFLSFQKNMIKGVIFNKMNEKVFRSIKPEAEKLGVKVLGYIPIMDCTLKSRHLGLIMPSEIDGIRERLRAISAEIERTVDMDALIALADDACDIDCREPYVERCAEGVRVALADDEAFCFTYADNVSLMERMGAEIIRFSPIHDERIPDADILVLPGGYPELYAEELQSNVTMRRSIFNSIKKGMPCLAECGGFMYLHERMEGDDLNMYRMCGVISGVTRNMNKLVRFGYVELTDGSGVTVKGHEFHHWDSDNCGSDWTAEKTSGFKYRCMHDDGTLIAGYPHLYYYSNPGFIERILRDIKNRIE